MIDDDGDIKQPSQFWDMGVVGIAAVLTLAGIATCFFTFTVPSDKPAAKDDVVEVARLIREEWKFRRSNNANISTPLIDKLITVASKAGGRAAKVCGAGGGGCVVFMVKDGAKERVAQALRALFPIMRKRMSSLGCPS